MRMTNCLTCGIKCLFLSRKARFVFVLSSIHFGQSDARFKRADDRKNGDSSTINAARGLRFLPLHVFMKGTPMKRITLLLSLGAALLFLIPHETKTAPHFSLHDRSTHFGFFYSSLQPHGEWIELEDGFYVWKPNHIRRSWRPYLLGRWEWTNHGWYWMSHEPFGWVVFHYGRWYYDDYYGWVWIPGDEWAPAWVEWRYDSDYIGWAPLPPYTHLGGTFALLELCPHANIRK
jgi:hypothetical protein